MTASSQPEFAWIMIHFGRETIRKTDQELLQHAKEQIKTKNVLISLVDRAVMGPTLKIKVLGTFHNRSFQEQLDEAGAQVDKWIVDLEGEGLPFVFADIFLAWSN
ncbi:hypothetical protein N7495_009934 [Penicillium taxi]|uniref:uncharacterized protein n=1 Tax=Penicillium taxi TaxID=168475 RepID=UPI00254597B9|nr:uncharacterized protein N7495_009934 [Penicillium taxi]KAJ5885424.1 hypothetical protein N7495_009934 [Penicillium taxi]